MVKELPLLLQPATQATATLQELVADADNKGTWTRSNKEAITTRT
jgi:hypothetical protein